MSGNQNDSSGYGSVSPGVLLPNYLFINLKLILLCFTLPLFLLTRYFFAWKMYYRAHLYPKENRIPPTLPHLIPLLGSGIPFAFDCVNFIKYAT